MIFFEVVGTFDLPPIEAGEEAESFKFRIEVLKDMARQRCFFARIYRRETLRVKPTFPINDCSEDLPQADHEILVADDFIGSDNFQASSKAAVLKKIQRRIEELFVRP